MRGHRFRESAPGAKAAARVRRDEDMPARESSERDAAYALCNRMYGTTRCSCEKRGSRPCETMRRGVAAVMEKMT